jgi:hypothetical protein
MACGAPGLSTRRTVDRSDSTAAARDGGQTATVMCISGASGSDSISTEMTQAAQRVCGALASQGLSALTPRVSDGPDHTAVSSIWPDVWRAWDPDLRAGPARLLFYEGHGDVRVCDGGTKEGLCLFAPRSARSFAWSRLAEPLAAQTEKTGWGVLILNACDSGYADVRGVRGPLSVLGSGYEHVPLAAPKGSPQTQEPRFAGLIASALGEPFTDANCDGVITDRELQIRVNRELRHLPSSISSNPIAVIRRQANADVPLLWTKNMGTDCSKKPRLVDLLERGTSRELPNRLQNDLRAQAELLQRERGKLVESSLRAAKTA